MKVKREFSPVTITLEDKEEVMHLLGILYECSGSSFIYDLTEKLCNEVGDVRYKYEFVNEDTGLSATEEVIDDTF